MRKRFTPMEKTYKSTINADIIAIQFDGRNGEACRKVAGNGEVIKTCPTQQDKEDDYVGAFVFSFASRDPEYNNAVYVGDWVVSINGVAVIMTNADFIAFRENSKEVAVATA